MSGVTNPISSGAVAGDVAVTPAGNLASTNVQAALEELQGDVDGLAGVLVLKDNIDCAANPNYPAATKGDTYIVTVAGKIGGASGIDVDIKDMIVCKTDNAGGTQAAVGTSWFILDGDDDLTAQILGNLINSATEKTTPVDADMVGLMDSEAGNIIKKFSWANIKATLKVYFDTVYDAIGAAAAVVSDAAYDATAWNGVTDVAPSKNALRDKFESLSGGDSYSMNADETKNTWYSYPLILSRQGSTTFNGWSCSGLTSGSDDGGRVNLLTTSSNAYATNETCGTGNTGGYRTNQSKGFRFKGRIKFYGTGIEACGIIAATATAYADQTSTGEGIRFVNNAGTLYASHSNGTTNVNTNIDSGITDTNWNIFEWVFTPGVDIKFYINGTLVATHTTSLPNSSSQMDFGFGLSANGSGMILSTPICSVQV